MATKLEGGGGKALVAGPLKEILFCGFSKTALEYQLYRLLCRKEKVKGDFLRGKN